MNIQIFGKAKCFDTQKAQRWFKERRIAVQYIDLPRYGMSRGEYQSVRQAVGGMQQLMDDKSRLYQDLFIPYLALESDKEEKLLLNPGLFRTPIVRCGKKATVGFCPEIWETWLNA